MSTETEEFDSMQEVFDQARRAQQEKAAGIAMENARTVMVMGQKAQHAFFATLVCKLKYHADWTIDTAATDGDRMIYNPDFMLGLSKEHVRFVHAHEVMHCFPAGTFVSGAWKPIDEMVPGDAVMGQQLGSRAHVVASRHYDGNLFTIRATGMLPIRATNEHPFYASTAKYQETLVDGKRGSARVMSEPRWVNAEDLAVGDWVKIPRIQGTITNHVIQCTFVGNEWSSPEYLRNGVPVTKEVAWFLGWYAGVGCTSETPDGGYASILTINASQEDEAGKLQNILRQQFGISSSIQPASGEAIRLQFSSRPFGKWLREHVGHMSKNVKIPDAILYNTDLAIVTAFAQGYMQANGSVREKHAGFSTTSRTMALQMQILGARLGFLFNLHKREENNSTIRGKETKGSPLYLGHSASPEAFQLVGQEHYASRPTREFVATDDAIWTKVRQISQEHFAGAVYNLETTCHTYAVENVVTHNCVYGHPAQMKRLQHFDAKRLNIAMDLVINWVLQEAGYDVPAMACLPGRAPFTDIPVNLTTLETYRLLKDKHTKGFEDNDAGGVMDPGGFGGVMAPKGEAGSDAGMSSTEQRWKMNVSQAAHAAKLRGTMSAGLEQLVGQNLTAKVNWREVLRDFLSRNTKTEYTWSPPNRRFLWKGLCLPRLGGQTLAGLIIANDTSGSMDMGPRSACAGEIQGICEQIGCSLTILHHDSQVCSVQQWAPSDGKLVLAPKGGGGTSHVCVTEWIKEHQGDEEISALICLTDLYSEFPSQAPDYPVLWCSTEKGSAKRIPFGIYVEIDEDTP